MPLPGKSPLFSLLMPLFLCFTLLFLLICRPHAAVINDMRNRTKRRPLLQSDWALLVAFCYYFPILDNQKCLFSSSLLRWAKKATSATLITPLHKLLHTVSAVLNHLSTNLPPLKASNCFSVLALVKHPPALPFSLFLSCCPLLATTTWNQLLLLFLVTTCSWKSVFKHHCTLLHLYRFLYLNFLRLFHLQPKCTYFLPIFWSLFFCSLPYTHLTLHWPLTDFPLQLYVSSPYIPQPLLSLSSS